MFDEKDFQKRVQCIGELVRELDSIADPAARTAAKELVQVLMDLHGTGLERMMEITFESGEPGQRIVDKLGADPLVSSLLVLYGIHPLDFEARVTRALDRIRPALRKHGCEFEVLNIQDAAVHIRARVGEHSCGSTAKTVRAMLEDAIYEAAPDMSSLQVEGLEGKPANGFVGLDTLLGSHAAGIAQLGQIPAESGD